jgi:hypothetical protein
LKNINKYENKFIANSGMHSTMGLICGSMTGFVRTIYSPVGIRIKLSPVDFVINATIVSAWKKATMIRNDEVLFLNCTDADENPYTWDYCCDIAEKNIFKYAPYKKIIWYPRATVTASFTWHMISLLLFQIIPALFFDLILFLSGRKPMSVLHLQKKL